jgi:hypothetical protein
VLKGLVRLKILYRTFALFGCTAQPTIENTAAVVSPTQLPNIQPAQSLYADSPYSYNHCLHPFDPMQILAGHPVSWSLG